MTRCCVVLLLLSSAAFAHKGSDAYWTLSADGRRVSGTLDVSVKDLDAALTLDANGDGAVTWGELSARKDALLPWLGQHVAIAQGEAACPLELGGLKVVRHSDGVYATVPMQARCGAEVSTLTLSYSLLFDIDAQHRGLVRLEGPGGGQWRSFSTDARSLTLDLTPPPVGQQTWLAFREGVHHITIGWDHLCFLFALLLPSVLLRQEGRWLPRAGFKASLVEVTKVVTAFTVAHSITLGLSAFGVLAPNAKWVEVAIAFSVVLAALNTVFPVLTEGRWALAFGLGLLHGFGFVSALADLGATGSRVWASVLGFNLGVEAGQLAIVACFVPLAFLVRERPFYRRVVVPVGALAITVTASVWTLERLGLL